MTGRAAVLCYHDLVPDDGLDRIPVTHRPYVVSPEEFRAQLLAIRSTRRRVVPVGELVRDLGGGTVAITFDDGWASDYAVAFPALREVGMRATFFVVPTLVGTAGHVTWAELREMVAGGMEIGSHSLTHPLMHALDRPGVEREFGESKTLLESRLGLSVRVASLPRGWEPPAFEPVLRALGYKAFCTSRVGWWRPGANPMAVPRVGVRRGMTPEAVASIASAAPRALWKLQSIELIKNGAKRVLGVRGWDRVRRPLLTLREHL